MAWIACIANWVCRCLNMGNILTCGKAVFMQPTLLFKPAWCNYETYINIKMCAIINYTIRGRKSILILTYCLGEISIRIIQQKYILEIIYRDCYMFQPHKWIITCINQMWSYLSLDLLLICIVNRTMFVYNAGYKSCFLYASRPSDILQTYIFGLTKVPSSSRTI